MSTLDEQGQVNNSEVEIKKDEFELIRFLTSNRKATVQGVATDDDFVRIGIGDDAAIVRGTQAGHELVLTIDSMVEGVHFVPETMTASDVGYKALSSAVSDIAAMGGTPETVLVAVSIPRSGVWGEVELKFLYDGLEQSALDHDVQIVGGDTTSTSGPLTITVSVTGRVPAGQSLTRGGAKQGDILFITGDIGMSAAGLDWMLREQPLDLPEKSIQEMQVLIDAHQRPRAQIAAGQILLKSGVCSALNDISDGLVSECYEIADASNCHVILYEDLIPVHPAMVRYGYLTEQSPLTWCLYGGEDYQLVGCVPAHEMPRIQSELYEYGIYAQMIGTIETPTEGQLPRVELMFNNEQRALLKKLGYNHFTKNDWLPDVQRNGGKGR